MEELLPVTFTSRFSLIETPFDDNCMRVQIYAPTDWATTAIKYRKVAIVVTPRSVSTNDASKYCSWQRETVERLAREGGIGVYIYDLRFIEVPSDWKLKFAPFAEVHQKLAEAYNTWLQRAYVYLNSDSSILELALTIWRPTRPVSVSGSLDDIHDRLSRLWCKAKPP